MIQDLALSIVGGLYQYFLDKRKQHMTLLVGMVQCISIYIYYANIILYYIRCFHFVPFHSVGTSGDTGSAAINAVKSKRWIDIVVLYPKVAKFLMCPIIVRFGKFYPFSAKE